jgi:putative SOS response-associated peptidase YedK
VRDSRLSNYPRRWNGAPSQEFLVIRQNHQTGERWLDLLKWGLIPYWNNDPKGGRKPINATPVDGFFEWRAAEGGKQPYAIATKYGSPFGIAGIWENWKAPASGGWERTSPVLTVPPNDLVARIHDRMPAILEPESYDRWLGIEPDPRELLVPYPAEPMRMWPISKRVNTPKNDDAALLDPLTGEAA